jgi:pimeloyl-[acyl-carrier protein] synthase
VTSTAALMASPEFVDDPYPVFADIRESDPVHFVPEMNAWLLTRFADVRAAFNDDRLGVMFEQYQVNRIGPTAVDQDYFRVAKDSLVCNDPPVHTEMRRLFRRAFSVRRVEAIRGDIAATCTRYVDAMVERGSADLIADFSLPVPLAIISTLLGVPESDQRQIGHWVARWAPVLEVSPMSPAEVEDVNEATRGLEDYFAELVAARRRAPGDDFVSEVLALNAEGEVPLDDEALIANLLLLYFAGQDTQKLMLGNIVVALHRNPDSLRFLAGNPDAIDDAMPELYRYDTVGQFMGRTPEHDLEFAGKPLQAGQTVMVCMGAANRDPAYYPDPDRLELDRPRPVDEPLRNLTFGHGRHRCLGAYLAQTNLPTMLRELLTRLPGLHVEDDRAVRHPSIATRGYDVLPVAWG